MNDIEQLNTDAMLEFLDSISEKNGFDTNEHVLKTAFSLFKKESTSDVVKSGRVNE